jgi:O-acetylhomoserine/O-acetylserine sulfhydrylase-like pyridoxal-dependent enzyme
VLDEMGIANAMFGVGIEHIDDITADFSEALKVVLSCS